MIAFTVPGNPIPWERARIGSGRHSTAPRTRAWQAQIKVYALHGIRHDQRRQTGPISIRLRFYRSNAVKADWDNLAKSVCDALNGIAYVDDQQIDIALVTRGIDREFPRVEVEITPHEKGTP